MRAVTVLGLAVVAAAALARPAHAFPQLTIRGAVARCTMCHVSPAGGGMLTEYGRNEASDTLSRGGDPSFAGAWTPPSWLLLGGDLRAAALAYEDRDATQKTQLAAFPMQADLRAGVTAGGFTIVATGGLRGSTRTYTKSKPSYVESSEHYVMYASDGGLYVRAGRFFPTFGLRLPDHTLYVRRYTGTNLFEEPYGIDAGYVGDDWEVHAMGFDHEAILDMDTGRRESGGALHAALHSETGEIAVSARYGTGSEGTRVIAGPSARLGIGRELVLLAEADAIHDAVAGSSAVNQLVAFAGADQRIVEGLTALVWLEEYQEALGNVKAAHHGAGLSLAFNPRAHWEIIAESHVERLGGGDVVGLDMLQVHYYP